MDRPWSTKVAILSHLID